MNAIEWLHMTPWRLAREFDEFPEAWDWYCQMVEAKRLVDAAWYPEK